MQSTWRKTLTFVQWTLEKSGFIIQICSTIWTGYFEQSTVLGWRTTKSHRQRSSNIQRLLTLLKKAKNYFKFYLTPDIYTRALKLSSQSKRLLRNLKEIVKVKQRTIWTFIRNSLIKSIDSDRSLFHWFILNYVKHLTHDSNCTKKEIVKVKKRTIWTFITNFLIKSIDSYRSLIHWVILNYAKHLKRDELFECLTIL